jgi:hypothetical protein
MPHCVMAKLSALAKSRLYANLEKYARSGMGMEKACESLLQQPRLSSSERRIYRGLLSGLKSGKSIGASLGASSTVVSPLEEEVVTASEAGGRLDKGFGHLAEYFRRIDRTRRKIFKGLAYPIFLIHLAVPVSTLMVAVSASFSLDGEGTGAGYREAFLNSGKNMLLVYLVVLLALLFFALLHRLGRTSAFIDGFLCGIPLLGKARRAVAMERFSQVFEIFLLAGRTMSDSLDGAGRASGSGRIESGRRAGPEPVSWRAETFWRRHFTPHPHPETFPMSLPGGWPRPRRLASWIGKWRSGGDIYSESAAEAMDQLGEWTPETLLLGDPAARRLRSLFARALAYRKGLIENLLNIGG